MIEYKIKNNYENVLCHGRVIFSARVCFKKGIVRAKKELLGGNPFQPFLMRGCRGYLILKWRLLDAVWQAAAMVLRPLFRT